MFQRYGEVLAVQGLSVQGLSFAYGRKATPIFDNFDLQITTGKTVLLGQNGAGKSTLLNLFGDVFRADKGTISLDGVAKTRSTQRAYRSAISLLPQSIPVIDGFTVEESVRYAAWLKGCTDTQAGLRAPEVLELVGLLPKLGRKASSLSGGELRRLGIAQALAHNARVVLLDEPSAGLDPIQQGDLRALLAQLDPEITLVVSTHQTQDISSIYDQVLVLDAGRILWQGSVQDFTASVPDHLPQYLHAEWAFEALIKGNKDAP